MTRAETIVVACTILLVAATPAYWFLTASGDDGADWRGTAALLSASLLSAVLALAPRGRAATARTPGSWWPLWCALLLGVVVVGLSVAAWWLSVVGVTLALGTGTGCLLDRLRGVSAPSRA